MTTTPSPVDIYVGGRLRLRRTLLGMSQEIVAQALELSFQQLQKYEHGTNRIGASRLYHLSQILDIPIIYFFDGAPTGKTARGLVTEANGPQVDANPLAKRETLELVRAYSRISDRGVRRRLLDVAKAMAKLSPSV